MTCTRIGNAILCTNPWGRLHVGNRYIWVDYHEWLGPSFSYANGEEYVPRNSKDPVWPEFNTWLKKYRAKKERAK